MHSWRTRKETTYPELVGEGSRAKLIVLAAEVGGRWSAETAQFLGALAASKARSAPEIMQASVAHAWRHRWRRLLACTAAKAFACSLLERPLSAKVNIIFSAILSHSPCGLSSLIEYHFFSDPGPRNDHCSAPNLFARNELRIWLAFFLVIIRSPWDVIEHRHEDCPSSKFSLVIRSILTVALGLCGWAAMWWILGKFHSNSICSSSIRSKSLRKRVCKNHLILLSHALTGSLTDSEKT